MRDSECMNSACAALWTLTPPGLSVAPPGHFWWLRQAGRSSHCCILPLVLFPLISLGLGAEPGATLPDLGGGEGCWELRAHPGAGET